MSAVVISSLTIAILSLLMPIVLFSRQTIAVTYTVCTPILWYRIS